MTRYGGQAMAMTSLGGHPDSAAISRHNRDGATGKQQRQDGGERTKGAAATQRHHIAADDCGSGCAGRCDPITGPEPVAGTYEATNKQRHNDFARGMIVPMVSWAR